MARGVRRGAERERFWRDAIAEWKRSGQSVRAFCQSRSLTEGNFYSWRRSLVGREDGGSALVPVRVVPDAAIEVVLRTGVTVRIPVGVPSGVVAELINALSVSC